MLQKKRYKITHRMMILVKCWMKMKMIRNLLKSKMIKGINMNQITIHLLQIFNQRVEIPIISHLTLVTLKKKSNKSQRSSKFQKKLMTMRKSNKLLKMTSHRNQKQHKMNRQVLQMKRLFNSKMKCKQTILTKRQELMSGSRIPLHQNQKKKKRSKSLNIVHHHCSQTFR